MGVSRFLGYLVGGTKVPRKFGIYGAVKIPRIFGRGYQNSLHTRGSKYPRGVHNILG